MKKLLAVIGCLLLLALSACSSGHDSKQSSSANNAPKKSVFDPYMNDVKKAKQVQGNLDAAHQKQNAQYQQAVSGSTTSQPPSANDSDGN